MDATTYTSVAAFTSPIIFNVRNWSPTGTIEWSLHTMDFESVVSQVQRKIELQSHEDLAYLVANVRAAATAELDKAFPHVAGHHGDNDLRNQVEKLVNDVILPRPFPLCSHLQ